MKRNPPIKTVMSTFPFSVESTATISAAREMMLEHKIRHLPVTDQHAPVGLITERDILVAYSLGGHLIDPSDISVGLVCTRDPFTVDLHAPVAEVAKAMAERHIGTAIVLREGRLAGIFTTTDACRFIAEQAGLRDDDGEPEAA